jgi:hypothetical protein
MKIRFDDTGALVITTETYTEGYALSDWFRRWKSLRAQIKFESHVQLEVAPLRVAVEGDI